jgi:hypothetical protein
MNHDITLNYFQHQAKTSGISFAKHIHPILQCEWRSITYAAVATPCKLIISTCAPNCKLHNPIFFILFRRVS